MARTNKQVKIKLYLSDKKNDVVYEYISVDGGGEEKWGYIQPTIHKNSKKQKRTLKIKTKREE